MPQFYLDDMCQGKHSPYPPILENIKGLLQVMMEQGLFSTIPRWRASFIPVLPFLECWLIDSPLLSQCHQLKEMWKTVLKLQVLSTSWRQPVTLFPGALSCSMANCQYGCDVVKGQIRCQCPSPGLQLAPDGRTCVGEFSHQLLPVDLVGLRNTVEGKREKAAV